MEYDYSLVATEYMVVSKKTGDIIGFVDDEGDVAYRGWVLGNKGRRIRVGDFDNLVVAAKEVYARHLGFNT